MEKAGAWLRVSSDEQESANQWPDIQAFASHHGYEIAAKYEMTSTAWKNGGGKEYKDNLQQALDDAWTGKFKVLIVWALDRIVRDDENGAEVALRIIRQFRERGCTVLSVQESWLNGAPEVQDVLLAFAGWVASRESRRRSERTKAGIARKMAEDPSFRPGRQQGAGDKKPRRRSGYLATYEPGGARRAALDARKAADAS
jgi:putative DNA-invertase from lambdoid prophage Rac